MGHVGQRGQFDGRAARPAGARAGPDRRPEPVVVTERGAWVRAERARAGRWAGPEPRPGPEDLTPGHRVPGDVRTSGGAGGWWPTAASRPRPNWWWCCLLGPRSAAPGVSGDWFAGVLGHPGGRFSAVQSPLTPAGVGGRPVKRTVVRVGAPSGVALTAQPLDGPGGRRQGHSRSRRTPPGRAR